MNQSEINLKNLKPVIFIVIVLILTAVSAYPQRKFVGKVVEVVDGKTFVMEMAGRQLTGVLQFIEIPEPDQPLRQTVKEHLQALIFDKTVEFSPNGVMQNKAIGQVLVKGVDVSQQMLRDGAAWYSVPQKSGQNEAESTLYQNNETQAKTEKRGVWGVENLKPSWEFRAEKEALLKKQEEEAITQMKFAKEMQTQKRKLTQPQQVAPQAEMWANVGNGDNEFDKPLGIGGLRSGYVSPIGIGQISVPSFFLESSSRDFLQKVESRIFYAHKGDKANTDENIYMIGFITTTKEYKFSKLVGATITADGEKLVLGKMERFPRENISSVSEFLIYEITRAQLTKIAKSKNVAVQFGGYSGTFPGDSLPYISNLLDITY